MTNDSISHQKLVRTINKPIRNAADRLWAKCTDCERMIDYQYIPDPDNPDGEGKFRPMLCGWCMQHASAFEKEKYEREKKNLKEYFRIIRGWEWKRQCPPLYSEEFDSSRLKTPQSAINKVLGWKFGTRGLVVHGETGLGKTRTCFKLLERLYTEGRTVAFFSAKQFGQESIDASMSEDGGKKWFSGIVKKDVVLLDDFGKGKITPRVEMDLFALFEERTSLLKPILVTTNFGGLSLRQMMSDGNGDPLLRRMNEFCEAVEFRVA